jgi:hypothetical protein
MHRTSHISKLLISTTINQLRVGPIYRPIRCRFMPYLHVGSSVSNWDPACNRDPASISTTDFDPRLISETRLLIETRLLSEALRVGNAREKHIKNRILLPKWTRGNISCGISCVYDDIITLSSFGTNDL